jgi:methanogenic corrinoid protein MtbC1
MLNDLSSGFIELKKDEVLASVKSRIELGDEALQILEDAHIAMIAVGKKFQEGEIYLAEMLLAAEIFKEVLALLEPQLVLARSPEPRGSVVLATPKGDIHDLGKNIFATLLSSQGFRVYDLGVDVDPSLVVKTVQEVKPDFVGFSALITTAFASMKHLTDIFEKEALRSSFKLMVGGGVTTPLLKDHIGADFQSTNAMDGVNYCLEIMAGKTSQSLRGENHA